MENLNLENLNYLDAALGGIVILSTLIGLARGLVKEILSLIAWVAAIYVAWRFSEQLANDHIRQFIDDSLISYLAAFGLLFLGSLFVIGLFNLIITQLLVTTGLGFFNRFLGMLFGLARGLVIGALVVFIISLTPLTKESWWKQSELQPGFAEVGNWAWEKLPPNIRTLLRNGTERVAEVGISLGGSITEQHQTEYTGQSGLAKRPESRVAREQRNAISAMSEAEQEQLRLESLNNEHPAYPQTESENSGQNIPLTNPPLQLESVQ